MKTFVILGISAAVCDVFYAPCTAMGKRDPIPLSPYVGCGWIRLLLIQTISNIY